MNRAYRHVWNHALQMFVAVAEIARSRGKRSGGTLLLAGTLAQAALAGTPLIAVDTLPTNGTVTAGATQIASVGNTMNINQATQKVAIDWLNFSIGRDATVKFIQPSASAIALNRVTGSERSVIEGALNANGKVFVLNSNGVLFTQGASINTAGLVASTMSLSNEDFMAGNYRFANNGSNASVVNFGNIAIADGGYAALLGKTVSNQGTITAKLGTVVLAAGERVSLNFNGDSLVNVTVDQPTLNALVENRQAIYAEGGTVILTAKAVDALMEKVVNNEGVISARSVRNHAGRVFLDGGDSGLTVNAGGIVVSSADGSGGKVVASGDRILLAAGSSIDASGATGGGEVYVGGGRQGLDAAIRNANGVVMEGGAAIDVSATDNGNGGTAVLFASLANPDSRTDFGGTILARGGANGGDGGFIETSAANVNFRDGMRIDSGAPQGQAGDWLIDPVDITIDATLAGAIVTALNSSNVTITTSGSNTPSTTDGESDGAGDITVASAIAKTGSSATTLTLSAHNDINVNAAISSSSGRLNVVLTADSDASSAGSVNFGATGSVTTNNGNFYVGTVSGPYDTLTAKGQNFTMATGSYIDVGQGMLGVNVNGNIQLPDNSTQTKTYALTETYNPSYRYYNGGGALYYYQSPYQAISLTSVTGAITTANTNAAIADIVTSASTYLNAGTIGSATTPIKVAGATNAGSSNSAETINYRFPSYGQTLYVTNSGSGGTYINEINKQIFSTVNLTTTGATNGTQNIQIMGDAGGNGTTGTGHIIASANGAGTLTIGARGIDTSGRTGTSTVAGANNTNYYEFGTNASEQPVFSTSVVLNAPTISLQNDATYAAANTGSAVSYRTTYYGYTDYTNASYFQTYSYYSAFAANGSTAITAVNAADNKAEIKSVSVSLNAPNIGTTSSPIEVAAGSYLNVYNTGGSSYIKAVDNSFSVITLQATKTSGVSEILFSGGDHVNVASDGSNVNVATIGDRSDGLSFGTSTGIDTTGSNRQVTLNARTGGIIFDDNSVNTKQGKFTAQIDSGNSDAGGVIAAKNAYNASAPAPQITAGDIEFDIYNTTAPGTIGEGGKDIQIAQGTGATNNTLTVYTQRGNVNIHETTANHLKTVNITLNNSSAAQTVALDLNGPDDVNFSDSGSLVTIDATKVNLSANNRNWNLQASSRLIQVDGTSLGTGNYTLYGGNGLKLNSDILTNGGNIDLSGYGATNIALMKNVRIDSNADDINNSASTGSAGSIRLNGTISGVASGYSLTVDSGSSDTNGNTIQMYSSTGNTGGAYLSGLIMTTKGSTNTNDGQIGAYGQNYLLNGNFSATGNTYLYYPTTIDTEQGNVASAGNITFAGYNLSGQSYYSYSFNANTTHANGNGGNVDLYGTVAHGAFSGNAITINTTGGANGTSGDISLPAMTTTYASGSNTQSYTGGIITLNGNLTTDKGAVSLTGDVRLASNVVIDTWASAGSSQTRTAGAVTVSGTGVSATSSGKTLSIDTSAVTPTNDTSGSGYYTGTTNWSHSGGAVSIKAGSAGGSALGALTVTTTTGGSHNTGTKGAITLNGVTTTGAQSYTGGATSITGDLTGDSLGLSGVASIALTGDRTLSGDTMGFGDVLLSGSGALTLKPTTADTTIGIAGGAGTLSLGSSFFSTNLQNGFSQLTVGSANSGDMSFGSDGVTFADPVKFVGGANIALAGTLADVGSGTSAGGFTAQANNRISLASGTSITTHAQAILLNANTGGAADGSGIAGGIDAHLGAITLDSGGGDITLGGGAAGSGAGYATGMTSYAGAGNEGIAIADGSTIAAGGGNIALRGQGKYADVTGRAKGIEIGNGSAGTTTIATSGSGAITLDGRGDAAHTGNWNYGVNLNTAGTINVQVANGGISISGVGGGTGAATANPGVFFEGAGSIAVAASGSGNLVINGTAGNGATSQNVDFGSGARALTTATGNIEVHGLGNTVSMTLPAALTAHSTSGNILFDDGHAGSGSFGDSATVSSDAGRWLIYSSATPASSYHLAYDFKQFGATYGSTAVAGAGNGFLYTLTPTVSVDLTGTVSKTYDGNGAATLGAANYIAAGALNNDVVSFAAGDLPTAGSYGNKNAGSGKTVTVTGLSLTANATATDGNGKPVYGYQVATTASGNVGTITPKTLTADIVGTPTKTHDGTDTAHLGGSNFSLAGFIGSESATVTKTTGVYDSADAASAATVTTTLASSDFAAGGGTLLANYALPTSASGPGTITAAARTQLADMITQIANRTQLADVITQIANNTVVVMPVTSVPTAGSPTAALNQPSAAIPPTTVVITSVAPPAIRGDFGDGTTLTVASRPSEGIPSTLITLDQLLQMQQSSAPAASGQSAAAPASAAARAEVRVRLGADSLVELVNGGVHLPTGVSQEFYVVREHE